MDSHDESLDQKMLYIGAFTDTLPVTLFPSVKQFIFIDQSPEDLQEHWPEGCLGHHICQSFIENLELNLKKQGLLIEEMIFQAEKRTIIFKFDGDRSLYYFYNTDFPNDLTEDMSAMIDGITDLYIKGYSPDIENLPYSDSVFITQLCIEDYDQNELEKRGNIQLINEYDLDTDNDCVDFPCGQTLSLRESVTLEQFFVTM